MQRKHYLYCECCSRVSRMTCAVELQQLSKRLRPGEANNWSRLYDNVLRRLLPRLTSAPAVRFSVKRILAACFASRSNRYRVMESDHSSTGLVLYDLLSSLDDTIAWNNFVDRYGRKILVWCRRWGLQ